ncbi:MAG TPA: hypothetical protein VJS44_11450 [Pyrinomonadaceae bacterium]|nr:hypothetical protein [Pyrinomonadaceae bacterium]
MNLARVSPFFAKTLLLSLVLQTSLAGAASARETTRQPDNKTLRPTVTAETSSSPIAPDKAEADQFRADLKKQLEDLDSLTDIALESDFGKNLIESAGLDPKGTLRKAIDNVKSLSDDDALRLKNSFEKSNPNWKESAQKMKNVFNEGVRNRLKGLPAKPGRQKGGNASLTFSGTDSRNAALILDKGRAGKLDFNKYSRRLSSFARNSAILMVMPGVDPQTCDPGPGTPMGITDLYIAKGVALGLQAVMEALPTDAITIAAREAPLVAYFAAEAAALVLEGLNEVEAECEDAKFQDNTITKLNNIQNSVNQIIPNDNANRDTILDKLDENTTVITTKIGDTGTLIINNDNQNKTEIITNDNNNKNELRDLILRSQIEADLAQPEGATPVALYEVPASQGGYLDLVQTIVAQTIARIQGAGGTTGNALNFLNTANAYKAAGNFKAAYDNYRKAYRAASK